MRVLYIEDDHHVRWMTDAVLFSLGHEVSSVVDAYEASEVLFNQGKQFDCIIVDKHMPGWSGVEFLRSVRSSLSHRDTPAIMLTADSDPNGMLESLKEGFNLHLTKPVSRELLNAAITQVRREVDKRKECLHTIEELQCAIRLLFSAEYRIRDFDQAYSIARLISLECRDQELAVLGVIELLKNAIEHGNLGLGGSEKKRLQESHLYEQELEYRLHSPEHKNKCVRIQIERFEHMLRVSIQDEGQGFDWAPYFQDEHLKRVSNRLSGFHRIQHSGFQELYFKDAGRTAVAHIAIGAGGHDSARSHHARA